MTEFIDFYTAEIEVRNKRIEELTSALDALLNEHDRVVFITYGKPSDTPASLNARNALNRKASK
jgi:hypothetical protein